VKQELSLQGRVVSGIIGKGGIVIKEIVSRSGAKIHVSPREAENHLGERVVEVTGSAEQVALALQLIQERRLAIEAQAAQQQTQSAPVEYTHQYVGDGLHYANAQPSAHAMQTAASVAGGYAMSGASPFAATFGQPQW
jgi:hypothetical protein